MFRSALSTGHFLGLFLGLLASQSVFLPELSVGEDLERQHLFGEWGGAREDLEEHGVSFESILTNDYIANVSGGAARTSGVLGNFDLTTTIDTEKAGLWKDGTAFVYLLGNYGRNPTQYVGDLQGTDNIEAYDTFKLYEAWYQHAFVDGKFLVLLGLHDYNSEFDALDYAATSAT